MFKLITPLDKILYIVLLIFMIGIGAGGALLRYKQEQIIETQKIREQQIDQITAAIEHLDGENTSFHQDINGFKRSQDDQTQKLDEALRMQQEQMRKLDIIMGQLGERRR